MKELHLTKEEKDLVEEVEQDEWHSVIAQPRDLEVYRQAAQRTMRKDKRVNIRISERDLMALQKYAAEEGLPYQTLISSILHKFVNQKIKV